MKKLSNIQRFVLHSLALYCLWLIAFAQWGAQAGGFDDKMTEITSYASISALKLLEHDINGKWVKTPEKRRQNVTYAPLQENKMFFISINSIDTVAIGNRCNALFTIALYIGFIMAYPGKWKPKLIFILGGSIVIFISNVIRIILLSFNSLYSPETIDFNHKYTYTFVVYSVVFILWMWWVNKYSSIANSQQPKLTVFEKNVQ